MRLPAAADVLGHALERIRAATDKRHRHPLFHENFGDGCTQAAGRAGHHPYFSF
jgi:hypothetical protein